MFYQFQTHLNQMSIYGKTFNMEHIQDFLAAYDLRMNYDIEHKLDNASKKIFYVKKAHYIMDTLFNGLKYKVRGTNEKDSPTYLGIGKYVLGIASKKNDDDDSEEYNYYDKDVRFSIEKRMINTLNDFQQSIKKREGEILFPGKTRQEKIIFRFTNNDLPYKNGLEYNHRKKVSNQKDYAKMIQKIGFEKAFGVRLKDYFELHQKY